MPITTNEILNIKNFILISIISLSFFALIEITTYELLYNYIIILNSFLFNLFIFVFIIILALYFRISSYIIIISIFIALISFFNISNNHNLINKYRLNYSENRFSNADVHVVFWGGGGFFQSAYFYYMVKSEDLENNQILETVKMDNEFAFLAEAECNPSFQRVNESFVLIGSWCG